MSYRESLPASMDYNIWYLMDVDDIDVDSMKSQSFFTSARVSSTGRSGSSIVSQSHTKKL